MAQKLMTRNIHLCCNHSLLSPAAFCDRLPGGKHAGQPDTGSRGDQYRYRGVPAGDAGNENGRKPFSGDGPAREWGGPASGLFYTGPVDHTEGYFTGLSSFCRE
ncbi:hypothetical protein [Tatumella terrea]|uniref:hypothetical protein n=1 Tax=Tatumella terrea TaxID=419007 RepID=UPI0031DA76C4